MKPATERAAAKIRSLTEDNLDSLSGDEIKENLQLAKELEEPEAPDEGVPEGAPKFYEIPQVGEIVIDGENPNDWGQNQRVRVTTGSIGTAEEVTYTDDYGRERTIGQKNNCNPDVPVVKGKYLDGGDTEYSFPVTRLSREGKVEQ